MQRKQKGSKQQSIKIVKSNQACFIKQIRDKDKRNFKVIAKLVRK